jgi:anti-sigma factor ChrR (cupin superfamily)
MIVAATMKEAPMTATTPFLKHAEALGPLASRYVEVEGLPWKPTPCPGIDMKVLLDDPETGLMTALFRWQPGAELALHEHVEIEQTFVIEGSLIDDEGESAPAITCGGRRATGIWHARLMARWCCRSF